MDSLRFRVQVYEADADGLRLDGLTLSLRGDLLSTDAHTVDRVSEGPTPAGSRGLDATTIGTLLVGVTSSTWAITQVIDTIRGWVTRGTSDCAVEISAGENTLRLSNPPTEQQQELVSQFLRTVVPTESGTA